MASNTEEIKARLDIVDVLSEYMRLKPAGTNWKGLCPFHNEKSPSFMVSKEKQFWHCFGCSEGGDVFTFVQKIEGIDFPEALRLLAQKAGVTLAYESVESSSQKNRLRDICAAATSFWHKTLLESPQAKIARDYLAKRGVSEKTIEDFKIGYAPDSWNLLLNALTKAGFKGEDIFLAGLVVKKDRANDFYDRFRNRVMFPINDVHGHPVGFSGRTLEVNPTAGKYINTPQTPIYDKSRVVFNLDKAKQAIKQEGFAVVVEGQMDAVSAYQAGTHHVVASSGTAFTPEQIQLIKRFTITIAIAFDMDAAGQNAALRGIDEALAQEVGVKVIQLPDGKDPDECIRHNPQAWFDAVTQAKSILEYYLALARQRYDVRTADGKKSAVRLVLPVIARIVNVVEQTHWLQQLADMVNVSEAVLREALPRKTGAPQPRANAAAQATPKTVTRDRGVLLAERLLALLLVQPGNIGTVTEAVPETMLADAELQALYKELHIYYTKQQQSTFEPAWLDHFQNNLTQPRLRQYIDVLALMANNLFADFDQLALRREVDLLVAELKRHFYTTQLKELERAIRQAEQAGETATVEALLTTFQDYTALLRSL